MTLEFKLINTDDPNEIYDLDATDAETAALEALERLGWGLTVSRKEKELIDNAQTR